MRKTILSLPLSLTATAGLAGSPVIDLWSGNNQSFGTLGQPQVWVNILGNAMDNADVTGFDAVSANGGTVVSNGNGSFTYTPPGGFTGTDSFTYTLTDDIGATDTATVSIVVGPTTPGAPVAHVDHFTTREGRSLTTGSVLANDLPVDNASITAFDANTVNGGQVTYQGDGVFIYYPPAPPFTGGDSFGYTLRDAQSQSDTATVKVTVLPGTSLPPTAVDDTYGTSSGTLTFNVLANDRLGDEDSIQSLTYSLNGGAALPLSVGPVPSSRPQRLVDEGDFNADIATNLLLEGENTVTITAQDRDGNQTVETLALDYSGNPVWPLPYDINWSAVSRIEDVTQIVDGRWVLEGDSVRTAQIGYDRTLAIGDMTWDNYELTVPVTVHGIDPVCINNSSDCRGSPAVHLVARWVGHYDEDTSQPEIGYKPIGGAVSYRYNNLSIACSTSLCSGSLIVRGNQWQTLVSDNSPQLPFGVTYLFKLRAETLADGHYYRVKMWQQGQSEPAQWDLSGVEPLSSNSLENGSALLVGHNIDVSFGDVSIVPTENVPPVANDDSFSVAANASNASLDVLANDSDPNGDTLAIADLGIPNAGGSVSINTNGTPSNTADDFVSYTPQAGFTGTETFTYELSDGSSTVPATVTVVVGSANNGPTISGTPDTSVLQDAAYSFTPTVSDDDGDSLVFSISNKPVWASFNTSNGALTGTPSNADVGTTTGIVISVDDQQGEPNSVASLPPFDLSVVNVNDRPTISGTPATTVAQGEAYSFIPTASDIDGDPLVFTIVNKPAWASFNATTGELSGTPTNADVGVTTGIVITVDDEEQQPNSTASLPPFDLAVTGVNDAPVVTAPIGAQSATQGVAFGPLDVSGNFTDPDGDALVFSISGLPVGSGLSISTAGVISGTPGAADLAVSPVNVTVTATDTAAATVSDTFVLTVSVLDSNGDGISDADALALGLDPNDPDGDTDNDGSSDVDEIGGDLSSPLDSDGDGVIDALEAGAAAADASLADNVALVSGRVDIISAGQTLSDVSTGPASGGPAGIAFPFGTLSFKTTAPLGGTVTVRLVFSEALPDGLALYKVDNAGVYSELPASLWSRVDSRTLDLTLTDGDALTDQDGAVNGEILDPVAPADLSTPTSEGGGGGGGCSLAPHARKDPTLPLLILVSLGYVLRRRHLSAPR